MIVHRSIVKYSTAEEAATAVRALNDYTFSDRKLTARLDRSRTGGHADRSSVYIGNLSWNVTDSYLDEVFVSFNPVSCEVMRNMYGRSRGCALVRFPSEREADFFISEMNGQEIDGRIVECRQDKGPTKGESIESTTSLYVGNLAINTTEEMLHALLGRFGKIAALYIKRRKDGSSKGWG